MRIPVMPALAVLGVTSLLLAMLAPLGTATLPAAGRLLFWAALVLGNAWKWRQWFGRVPLLLPASRAALPVLFVGGVAVLGGLLPLEYGFLALLSGLKPALPWERLGAAVLLAAIAVALVIVIVRRLAARQDPPVARSDQAV
jgi:hypothetical protein